MKFFFIPLACIFASGFSHASENWPRFRGPNGAGGADSSIPVVWGKSDYRWQLQLQENGHGSPAVWGNLVFLNSAADKGGVRDAMMKLKRDEMMPILEGFVTLSSTHDKNRLSKKDLAEKVGDETVA